MNNVCIIILNWNNWKDTLVCLESVLRNDYQYYKVLVCDNGSKDNSLTFIKSWADGALEVSYPPDLQLQHHIAPPVSKPIKYREYDRAQAENGGDMTDERSRLVLIQTGENLGFAGGNNVGLRYALARGDITYIWILNNDTIIKRDALTQMVNRMQEEPDIGICGSTLLYYSNPDVIQACGGGSYNKWTSYTRHIGTFKKINETINQQLVESRTDYIVGASMLISKQCLEEIGLMCEDYFLYYEDIDWAIRAKKTYKLAYASKSLVYHKEGESSGAGHNSEQKSLLSDYYSIRSRLLFTRKHFPLSLPTVYLGLLVTITKRIIRRQYERVCMIIKLVFTYDKHDTSFKNKSDNDIDCL